MNKILSNNIQLNWLRTFEAAGRHLSFTLSAQELSMSQSAVSQQIQLLEHHLNQKLFVRANRTIQLTDAGRSFLPLVEDSINKLNTGAAQIFSPINDAVVEVSVNNSFSILWLAPRLHEFSAIYPQVSIRQIGNNWSTDFEITTAELEIRYGTGFWPGFESFQLITPKLRPYCTIETAKRLRQPSDLALFSLLNVIGTHAGWGDWLQSMALENIEPHQYMDSHAVAATMTASGFGLCLMYDEMMKQGVIAQQLVPPFMNYIETKGSFYLCYRSDRELSKASSIFRDWLLSTSAQAGHEKAL